MSEVNKKIRQWESEGWQIERKGKHMKMVHALTSQSITVASTPSDFRAIANTEAQMRRALENAPIKLVEASKPKLSQTPKEPLKASPVSQVKIPVDNPIEYRRAWKLAYIRLLLDGSTINNIHSARTRYEFDAQFRKKVIKSYIDTPATEIIRLRKTLRMGVDKIPAFYKALAIPAPVDDIIAGKTTNQVLASRADLERNLKEANHNIEVLADRIVQLNNQLNIEKQKVLQKNNAIQNLRDNIDKLFSSIDVIDPPKTSEPVETEVKIFKQEPIEEKPKTIVKEEPKRKKWNKIINPDSLGGRIKTLRLEQKLSLAEIGPVIGVHGSAIGHWEAERNAPTEEKLEKIATILGTTVEYLKTGKT